MQNIFIAGRSTLDDAADLLLSFGTDAVREAASRAEQSRKADNVLRFCHWRQIERVIVTLACDEPNGTIH